MTTSINVASGDTMWDWQYNNLRADALSASTGHFHKGTTNDAQALGMVRVIAAQDTFTTYSTGVVMSLPDYQNDLFYRLVFLYNATLEGSNVQIHIGTGGSNNFAAITAQHGNESANTVINNLNTNQFTISIPATYTGYPSRGLFVCDMAAYGSTVNLQCTGTLARGTPETSQAYCVHLGTSGMYNGADHSNLTLWLNNTSQYKFWLFTYHH